MNDSRLGRMLDEAVQAGTVPGAVALVGQGDDIWLRAAGRMAVDGPPMPADAIFRIQSMTKAVTSVATLLAVQVGRLNLHDPVEQWLPELADRVVLRDPDGPLDRVVAAGRPITVRDLLVNGSGYGVPMTDSPLAHAMVELGVDAGPLPVSLGADEWLTALATLPLAHQPGEGFRYHHSFGILGILLQRLAGVPLQQHLERAVFEPLGMVDTGFWVPEHKAHRLPAAYRHGASGLEEVAPLGGGFYAGEPPYGTAHGELVSTASDYHRLARMLAEGGRVDGRRFLDSALLAGMTRDQVATQAKTPDSFFPGFWEGTGWGYGVSVVTSGEHAGRYGWAGGLGTDFFVDPDGLVAILLMQVEMGAAVIGVVDRFQEVARPHERGQRPRTALV